MNKPFFGRVATALMLASAAAVIGLASAPAAADTYPDREIQLIVPFPAGGGVDSISRLISERLAVRLKQSIVVQNRTGAGGLVGVRLGAQAAPDGYTLTAASINFLTVPSIFANPQVDIVKDFEPVALVGNFPLILVVGPNVKEKTLKDIVAHAKEDPTAYTIGTSAAGGGGHVAAEMFKQQAGVEMLTIPYKGAAPMNVDLVGGRVSMSFAHITSIIEMIRAGRVRPIAISAKERSPLLPDVPTMAEEGLPDFTASEIVVFVAPAKTPKPIVEKLNSEINSLLNDKEQRARIEAVGGQITPLSVEEFRQYIITQSRSYDQVLKKAGVQPQ
ncbi:MAG TPA: tripartite tricarboxylate transporter substrate-binding protein [Hyphomicrobium sp.]|nr:tripartite tricarboxylate transporter substrate-binding protein [Hyphomicrobium sp.]